MREQAISGGRQVMSLDGAWDVSHEGGPWRSASVPGPWQAQFADLDGPLWLSRDRPAGLRFHGSDVDPPAVELWG